MARFNYLAQDAQGKQISATLEAKNILEAKTKLRESGLYLLWVKPEGRFIEKLRTDRIKNMDLAVFSHQFSVMISSGIPLIKALTALEAETNNKKLGALINIIRQDVANGASLSSAFSKHSKIFSNFFIHLIKTGEAGGVLPAVLNRLAKYLEKEEDLKRKIISSFSYPAIVGVVAVGAVIFLLIFIVPVFTKVYSDLKISLPGPTITLIFLSDFMIKFWWLILLFLAVVGYSLRAVRQNEALCLALDRIKLKLPLFGQLMRKVALSRFVRTLSTLLGSGLPLNSCLSILKEATDNRVFKNSVICLQQQINQGSSFADSLKGQAFFSPIIVQMVSAGEESGNLNLLLDKCADFLEEDIDCLIKSLVVKLEPALTILLAFLVGFIALAIYLPMFDFIRQVSR